MISRKQDDDGQGSRQTNLMGMGVMITNCTSHARHQCQQFGDRYYV